jgi:bifunctional DNA-binding transcriptional regulator/antitoxin component of YhaV-PrlF toxin-antitoxin module
MTESPAFCPCCGQRLPGTDPTPPEFVRSVDIKGRIALPAALLRSHGLAYAAIRDGLWVRLRPDPRGRPTTYGGRGGWRRYTIPAPIRHDTGILPGRDAAIARVGDEVLIWRR